ncbi:MAG: iron-only hydrogenase system regulator [Clostridia bacterium]|nr:iron-only hydrogenase system regulator [Clostridia bacterium]
MEERVAVISIILEDKRNAPKVNEILHDFSEYIIARMGIPYEKKGLSLISIAVDGPMDKISALSGKLGSLDGVSTKAVYTKERV